MAAKAKLVGARRPQVVAAHSAMRIVAVGAAHLALAQRVMIRQAHLPALGLMALQANVIGLPLRLNEGLGFRHEIFYRRDVALSHQIKTHIRCGVLLDSVIVGLMAIGTAHLIRGMRPGHPVANSFITGMAAQASAVSVGGGPFSEGDDLGDVSSTLNVQAARAMALLAFDALLRMERVAKVLGYVHMASSTGLGPNGFRAGYFHELGEGRNRVFGFLGSVGG